MVWWLSSRNCSDVIHAKVGGKSVSMGVKSDGTLGGNIYAKLLIC
jgi:hypothetical protein